MADGEKDLDDPRIIEAIAECDQGVWETKSEYVYRLMASLRKRGLEITEIEKWSSSGNI